MEMAGPGIQWMDKFLRHFETMRSHCLLLFIGGSSFQGFLGGAGFRPSTVGFHTVQLVRDLPIHCSYVIRISQLVEERLTGHQLLTEGEGSSKVTLGMKKSLKHDFR